MTVRSLVRKPRSDSYWGGLNKKQQTVVLSLLLESRLSMREARMKVPLTRKGKPPCIATLARLRLQLKTEEVIFRIDAKTNAVEAPFAKLRSGGEFSQDQEQMLDEAMCLISKEVIEKTLQQLDSASRTAAAHLLLKRADQRRVDRHQDFVEAQARKKAEPPPPPPRLTEEDKQRRIQEVLDIA